MARLTISQEEFDRLRPLPKRELLAFIEERLLRRSPGRHKTGKATSATERMRKYRERMKNRGIS